MFSTGTDEHGMKIEESAKAAGKSPQEYVDEIAARFKDLWKYMNISYDRFIRTTDDYHKSAVQKIFKALYDKGYIYKGEYSGKYCVPDESFWTASQLKDGKCPECGREVIDAKEEAYFMKMEPFAARIEELLTKTDFLQPQARVNEMVNNFIKPGLEDLCVSRTTFKWGVPVPFDEAHVIYVWIDALTNYITLLGHENDEYSDMKYWDNAHHMTAKEIVRFHSIIWIAILMGLELPLPKRLYSHGWINFDGKKMGKSTGNVIDPFILGERFGVDAIRYQILRDMPFSGDMDFSNELMLTRINTDLANDLGNLVSRTVAMVIKYFDGTIPAEKQPGEFDGDLISMASGLKSKVDELIDIPQLSKALEEIFAVISRANKYIDETEPWVLAKTDSDKPRLAQVLYNLLETIRISSSLLAAFMPAAMPKVFEQIGVCIDDVKYEQSVWNADFSYRVKKGDIIFPRFDIAKELEV
jgi:methionyl-tRNA synthetase